MTSITKPPGLRHLRKLRPAFVLALGLVNLSGCGCESRTAAPPQPATRSEPAPVETAAKPTARPAAETPPPDAGETAPNAAPEKPAARPGPGDRPSDGAIGKANQLRQRAQAERRAGRTQEAYDTLNAAWDAVQADADQAEGKALGQTILGELDEVSRELDASRGVAAPADLSSKPLITR